MKAKAPNHPDATPGVKPLTPLHDSPLTSSANPQEESLQLRHRLDRALDAAGIGVWEYDHVADASFWHPCLRALLGYSAEQAPTDLASWLSLIHPDDLPDVQARVETMLSAAGNPADNLLFEAEYRLRVADGRWRWFYARGRVVQRDALGQPLLSMGTLTDISERKNAELLSQTSAQAETANPQQNLAESFGAIRDTKQISQQEALQHSETLLRATLDSTADGILVIGENGAMLIANRRFQELWRIPGELVAAGQDEPLLSYVLDQLTDPEGFMRDVQRLYRTDEICWDILHFKDGRIFERFTRAVLLDDQQARLWSFRDVTEERKIQRTLDVERTWLRTLIRTIPDLVWLKDLDGAYMLCNPAFER
ncbi:MAG: PAS domain S-box protein, partial [Candidatus Competibacteraceae bacterium]|nr:PAS domain S-box protein [Candidatus Competibacteraceae bacterium]